MKKIIFLALLIPVLACSAALAGDITPGSVPGSLNYQGRLERDNAPITGPIHLTFRIYTAPTGGTLKYAAPEIVVSAMQGIFSAGITPNWDIFSNAGTLYLEVQVESDVLSPREPLSSVAYALVAKKLEDGTSVSVTTLTTTGNVGIGTNNLNYKLTVNGSMKILTGGIVFPDGTIQTSMGVGSAGTISTSGDAIILADNDGNGSGNIIFSKPLMTFAAITNAGDMGIGAIAAAAPMGKLDVDGSLYVGNQGIYNRTGGSVTVSGLYIPDGGLTGKNSETILIGQTNNVIALATDGFERMRVHSNNNVGIGTNNPTAKLHVDGDILSNTGVRGGVVSMGNYTGGALTNEIRTQTIAPLLLQQTNGYNVGIGTDTPTERLHVKGNIKAELGMIAGTANFANSAVRVTAAGNFYANSGHNTVELSSTVIYGTLRVTGGTESDQGFPAYQASSNVFTGQNTFTNQVTVSSDIITVSRLGAGVTDFDFNPPLTKYLQIGDSAFFGYDAAAYIVSGESRNSRLFFYRGPTEAARFETQGTTGSNLALVLNNTKSLVDDTYYRIYNSVFWVSTGTNNNTPTIYASATDGNVGIGTAVLDPTHRLTVAGNIKISGPHTNGIIFADDTVLTSNGMGGLSVGSLANSDDVLVQADADANGAGDVILKVGALDGLIVQNGGRVGIGTLSPILNSKLNVRGGDLVLGTPYTGSGGSALEDIFVAGNMVVDGGITQRSATEVLFSALRIGGNVYLSTGAARTRIGSETAPNHTLDVTGDINASGNIRTGTPGTVRISNTGTVGSGNANATWDGNTIDVDHGGTGVRTFTTGGILYGNGTSAIGVKTLTDGQLLIGITGGAPAAATLTQASANRVVITNAGGSITLSLPQDIHTGASPTFTGLNLSAPLSGASAKFTGAITSLSSGTFKAVVGDYSLDTSSGILVRSGIINMSNGKVVNLADPTANQEAATKKYVDDAAGAGGDIGAWALSGNNISNTRFLGTRNGFDLVFKANNTEWMRITTAGAVQLQNALGTTYGGTGNATGTAALLTNTLEAGNSAITAINFADSGTVPLARGGTGNSTGNAATVTNGVYLSGDQTINGIKTFGSTISGSINGNAAGSAGTLVDTAVSGTSAITAINNAGATGTVPVDRGGTGRGTLAANEVLVGNGTSGINSVTGIDVAAFQVVGSTMNSICYNLTFSKGVLTVKTPVACN